MPRYRVNRGDGWPVLHEGRAEHQLGETFTADENEDIATAIEQGYLIEEEPATPPEKLPTSNRRRGFGG